MKFSTQKFFCVQNHRFITAANLTGDSQVVRLPMRETFGTLRKKSVNKGSHKHCESRLPIHTWNMFLFQMEHAIRRPGKRRMTNNGLFCCPSELILMKFHLQPKLVLWISKFQNLKSWNSYLNCPNFLRQTVSRPNLFVPLLRSVNQILKGILRILKDLQTLESKRSH